MMKPFVLSLSKERTARRSLLAANGSRPILRESYFTEYSAFHPKKSVLAIRRTEQLGLHYRAIRLHPTAGTCPL
jgi:hypothetical protein